MEKLTRLIIQIVLVYGIISAYECQISQERYFNQESRAIRYGGENYPPDVNGYEDKEYEARNIVVPTLDNRHIIDPPLRPTCRPCYRADAHGRCRRILGCTV